ncbi:MAG: NHL repeat-containing protein, partial [Planctomycetota bacterium]
MKKAIFFLIVVTVIQPLLFADNTQKERIMAKIESIEGQNVYLDKGKNAGIKHGMLFEVYKEAKVVYIPMSKERALVEEKKIALLEVTQVDKERTTCVIEESETIEQIEAGYTVVSINKILRKIENYSPVIQSIEITPKTPYPGEYVDINCVVTDIDNTNHIYTWSATGGQVEFEKTSCGTNRWVCSFEEGTYIISVTVDDLCGKTATKNIQIKSPKRAPRGNAFQPVAVFGDASLRFRSIISVAFDKDNKMLILDAQEKRIISLLRDFTVDKVSASLGENPSFAQMFIFGNELYIIDTRLACVHRYELEGDIFRRKPIMSYGSAGSGNGFFISPISIALNKKQDIYILDSSACSIQLFDTNGSFLLSFGKRGSGSGEMLRPVSLIMDNSENIYVCDRQRRMVLIFKNNAFVQETDFSSNLVDPIDMKINPVTGQLAILDNGTKTVKVFNTDGELQMEVGVSTNSLADLSNCETLTYNRIGEIFVVCNKGSVIKCFSTTGQFIGSMGGEDLSTANKFTIGSEGEMFLLSQKLYTIWRLNRHGWITAKFGAYGMKDGQFLKPIGMACDSKGCLYVADVKRCDIQKFSPEGTQIGLLGKKGSGNEQIDYPFDIYTCKDKIYFLQYRWNYSVHVYDTEGNIVAVFPDKDSQSVKPYQIAADKQEDTYIFSGKWYIESFG